MENQVTSAMDWALQIDQSLRNHESEAVRETWTAEKYISPLNAIMQFAETGLKVAMHLRNLNGTMEAIDDAFQHCQSKEGMEHLEDTLADLERRRSVVLSAIGNEELNYE